METATRIEIHFDSYRYEMSIKHWNKRKELLKSIDFELEKFFPFDDMDIEDVYLFFENENNFQTLKYGEPLKFK